MCLYISEKPQFRPVVYKVYKFDTGKYYSIYNSFLPGGSDIELGKVVRSDRVSNRITQDEMLYGMISSGIHVYNSLKRAKLYWSHMQFYLIECHVKEEDFVASGGIGPFVCNDNEEAVFTEITPVKVIFPLQLEK